MTGAVMCLDLGFANTGVAVLEKSRSSRHGARLVHVETIRTRPTSSRKVADDEWARTAVLVRRLRELVDKYKPAHVFIECPTGGSKSAKAAKSMALSRGACAAAMSLLGVPATLVTPRQAKKAATGDPGADKAKVKAVALSLFSDFAGWPKTAKGRMLEGESEHIFDAISVFAAAIATKAYKDIHTYD